MASSTRTVNVKFDGDAKGLAAAAKAGEREVDRFNKSIDKKFKKSGDDSGKGFNAGLKKWFSPSALGDIGKQGGTVFGSGFLGMIKTPVLGPAILAALAGAVAVALPAVGAIAAGGLVAGFGAGLAGLGLVFAAKSEKVKAAWQKTLAEMGADMRVLSRPFESTLISMAGVAKRTFATFKPELDKSFKLLAPALTAFGDQLGRAFEGLAPAIKPLSEAFAAVLRSLGPATQSAVQNISKGLQGLADSVKESPNGLADLVKGAGELTKVLLDGIATLNNINGAFEKMTGGVSMVDVVMGALRGTVGLLLGPFTLLGKALDKLGLGADKMNDSVQISAETTKLWTQGLDAGQVAAMGVGKAVDGAIPKVESLATKFERQWRATQKANQELFRNSGLLLTLSGASIAYEEAVDAATASVKENGRTLDINTAKGRANRTALDNLAASANDQTEAMRNAGDGNVSAAKHAEGARAAFVRQATQMGLSKKEAEKLAAKLIAIPNVSRTAKLNANITDLEGKLATAKAKLKDPKLTATQKSKLATDISKLEAGIRDAKGLLASVPSVKTVTIRYTATGVNLTTPSGVGRRASGGLTQPRRSYLVGERGPEIVTMGSSPARVTSAEASRSAGSDQPTIAEIHIEIGGEVVRVVRSEMKQSNRDLKRTVGAR